MKYATIRQDGVTELRQSPAAPQDAILLSDEQYEGLAQGSMILEAGDVVVNPNWPPAPAPWSPDSLMKTVKAGREIALNRLAGIAFSARENNDSATVTACLVARQSLLDITKLPAVLASTDDASLTAAIGTGYAAIVMACPSNIVNAFAGIQT